MKKYSEKKLLAALVCGAISLGGVNYAAAEQADMPVTGFRADKQEKD